MSASNFHGIVNGTIERNGTAVRNGKRPAPAKRIGRAAKQAPELAAFVREGSEAQDAPMWPIHPDMWLQPELQLAVPAASGLRIERQHGVPSPEFVREPMTPVSHPPSFQTTVHPVLPRVGQQLPGSGLAPLGWDPRVGRTRWSAPVPRTCSTVEETGAGLASQAGQCSAADPGFRRKEKEDQE
jgi:hypothetical protein